MLLSEVDAGEKFRFMNTPHYDHCEKRSGKMEYTRYCHKEIRDVDGFLTNTIETGVIQASFWDKRFDREVELIDREG